MRIESIKVYEYKLPLQTLKMKGQVYNERVGLILEFFSGTHTSYSEIAPLAGFSNESIEDVKVILPKVLSSFKMNEFKDVESVLLYFSSQNLYPSLQFALESAIFELLAQKENKNLAEYLNPHCDKKILKAALITEFANENLLNDLIDNNKIIKLKISGNIEDDIKNFNILSDLISENEIKIRLDANRKWTKDEAIKFLSSINIELLEFIEEPCKNYKDFEEIHQKTGAKIALDETIYLDRIKPAYFYGLSALVLKPTMLGSFRDMYELSNWAMHYNVKIIFSSSFESAIGIQKIIQYASIMNTYPLAHGLDTSRYFIDDLADIQFLNQAEIDVESINHLIPNKDKLNEILI